MAEINKDRPVTTPTPAASSATSPAQTTGNSPKITVPGIPPSK
jgi:hypothetical protein